MVVSGGWAGCAAALATKKAGAKVIVLVKSDCLLGTGLEGGIMRNNGRFTAAECPHCYLDFPVSRVEAAGGACPSCKGKIDRTKVPRVSV